MKGSRRLTGPYRAPWWLPGGHLQTIYAALFTPAPQVALRRTRWERDDGDFIDIDWCDGPNDAPLVVLFHGLEGSAKGHYARALMAATRAFGWRGAVIHFRGCSGEPNRLARAYHAGDATEIGAMLDYVASIQGKNALLFTVGVSLGGNALLKWLAQSGKTARACAAVAVSAPVDLAAAGNVLDRGFNRYTYTRQFLRTLKRKSLAKLERFPGLYDAADVRRATTLRTFDDAVTAPIHGFAGVDDYWTRASSKPDLAHIRVPTLLINARNDPFMPGTALPTGSEVSSAVTLEFPDRGGHVGFVSGPFPGNLRWLPQRILEFFSAAEALAPARQNRDNDRSENTKNAHASPS